MHKDREEYEGEEAEWKKKMFVADTRQLFGSESSSCQADDRDWS